MLFLLLNKRHFFINLLMVLSVSIMSTLLASIVCIFDVSVMSYVVFHLHYVRWYYYSFAYLTIRLLFMDLTPWTLFTISTALSTAF